MSYVNFSGIHKQYPNSDNYSVTDFNLEVKKGEFIVFVGPSGCGKSTTLRMLAGLEDISEGEISIEGDVINNVTPKDRDIAMVFQNYALYPHMTVRDNICFGLKVKKIPASEIEEKVEWAAEILGLSDYLNSKPKDLSGGQRQRVALGRAIVRNPKVFLMDEPLSNLDAKLRVTMREEITKLHSDLGATTIYVTHDQVEAMTMADRIVVMKLGIIQQIGTPMELFNNPSNVFVAGFIGAPQMNLFEVNINGDKIEFEDNSTITMTEGVRKSLGEFNGKIIIGLRPQYFSINDLEIQNFSDQVLTSNIKNIEHMGKNNNVFINIGSKELVLSLPARMTENIGDSITYRVDINKAHFFDCETELNIKNI